MYTALVLDKESHNKLLEAFHQIAPLGWERICHHMTINMGREDAGPAADLVGKTFEVVATTFAQDNKVLAVGVVSEVPSANTIKHITVAVNRAGGGKPFHSNDLKEWVPLVESIKLTGTVQVVN